VAVVLAATAGAAPGREAALHLQLVADGLADPTYAAAAPGEPRNLYVVEQPGGIRVLAGDRLRATPFLDIRGRVIPAFRGRYIYGDYCSGTVWSLRISGGRAVDVRREPISVPGLSSFGEDLTGELYAVSQSGRLFKLLG